MGFVGTVRDDVGDAVVPPVEVAQWALDGRPGSGEDPYGTAAVPAVPGRRVEELRRETGTAVGRASRQGVFTARAQDRLREPAAAADDPAAPGRSVERLADVS